MMMVAFIGQAMAYHTAFSIEPSADIHTVTEHVEQPQHIESADSDCQLTNCCDTDCCEIDCICPANACSSTTVLNSSIDSTDIQIFSESVAALQSKQPHSISTSLYRPPIFA